METKTSERALQASHIVDPRIISPAAPTAHGRSVRVATGTAYRSLLAGRAPRGRGGGVNAAQTAGHARSRRHVRAHERSAVLVRAPIARSRAGHFAGSARISRRSRRHCTRFVVVVACRYSRGGERAADSLARDAHSSLRLLCLPPSALQAPQLNSTRRSLNACGTFPSPPMGEKIRSFFRRRKRSEEQ